MSTMKSPIKGTITTRQALSCQKQRQDRRPGPHQSADDHGLRLNLRQLQRIGAVLKVLGEHQPLHWRTTPTGACLRIVGCRSIQDEPVYSARLRIQDPTLWTLHTDMEGVPGKQCLARIIRFGLDDPSCLDIVLHRLEDLGHLASHGQLCQAWERLLASLPIVPVDQLN